VRPYARDTADRGRDYRRAELLERRAGRLVGAFAGERDRDPRRSPRRADIDPDRLAHQRVGGCGALEAAMPAFTRGAVTSSPRTTTAGCGPPGNARCTRSSE
jgi:hypothetical protein